MPVISVMCRHLPRAVGHARKLNQHVHAPRRSAAGRRVRDIQVRHRHHRLQPIERVPRAVGVNRRQAAVVARVHRLQHVERFFPADLADDDAVRPHAQGVDAPAVAGVTAPWPSMLGGRVSRRTTWRCCSCSSAASSIVTMRSLSEMKLESALSSVVLPAPVPPETMMFSRAATHALEKIEHRLRQRLRSTRSCAPDAIRAESPDREHRPVERQRRDDGVDARAVLQPGVDHRAGLVDTPADHADDALDDPQQVGIVLEDDSVSSSRPSRSTYTWSCPLTRMSEMPPDR